MDGAAGAQYPSLDTPLFSTLAFCINHPPKKKTPTSISSVLLNLIKRMSTSFLVSEFSGQRKEHSAQFLLNLLKKDKPGKPKLCWQAESQNKGDFPHSYSCTILFLQLFAGCLRVYWSDGSFWTEPHAWLPLQEQAGWHPQWQSQHHFLCVAAPQLDPCRVNFGTYQYHVGQKLQTNVPATSPSAT